MRATESGDDDAIATLDFSEFLECLARCADSKYGEIELVPAAAGLRGLIENLFGRASDEAIIRDATYIYASRYDWADSRPLPGQTLALHRRWRDCWQNIEIADLHHFPLWEKGVHDVLQPLFGELQKIFSHYAKGATGGETAEDAVRARTGLSLPGTMLAAVPDAMLLLPCLCLSVGIEPPRCFWPVATSRGTP